MLEDLFQRALKEKREICVEATQELLEEIMELVKRGELKPTVLANPIKSRVSLYKPMGEGRIHVRITKDRVCVHYDERDPARDPIGHILKDTEVRYVLIAFAIAVLAAIIKKLQKGRG